MEPGGVHPTRSVLRKPEGFARETDYRFEVFRSWCAELTGKRVGVYGSGANAKRVVACLKDAESIAVIDDAAIGSTFSGHSVKGIGEALTQNLDAIIIAAEFTSALVIARRIKRLCYRKRVTLYDMYGNDLQELEAKVASVLSQRRNDRYALLDACDVICVNAALFLDECSPSVQVGYTATDETFDRNMLCALEYAAAQGKTVVFYYTEQDIALEKIYEGLDRIGFCAPCEILLGNEVDLWAQNGIYRVVYERERGKRIVHIGGDVFKDCIIPLAYGKESILGWSLELAPELYRPYGLDTDADIACEWFTHATTDNSCSPEDKIALCALNVLPQIEKRAGKEPARIVSVVAPLVVGYVSWLVESIAGAGGQFAEVLFASRDACLVKKVYDLYGKLHPSDPLPASRYFYTSRKSSQGAAEDPQQRMYACDYFATQGLVNGGTYAFVEFVGAGTCQRQIEQFAPFKLFGFYFGSRLGDALSYRMPAAFYFDGDDASFLSRYLVLETLLSSDEPSLTGYAPGGALVFSAETRTEDELCLLRAVHEGVILFAREYFATWHERGDVIDHEFVNDIMPALDACQVDSMSLYDDLYERQLSKDIWVDVMHVYPSNAGGDVAEGDSGEAPAEALPAPGNRDALLYLLRAFDCVCREFGLTYVATHGTLLGAIRHHGFIPGDDDLDVAMPRADYDRLLELAEMGVFPCPMFLQTPENDPNAFSGGYAKLWYKRPTADNDDCSGDAAPGVWMDIMPLDNCPLSDVAVARRQRVIRSWQRTLYAQTYGCDMGKLWDVNPKRLSVYFVLAERMSRKRLCACLRMACMAGRPTGMLTVFAGNYRRQPNRVRYSASDVAKAQRVPFEDTTVPVPRNAQAWLAGYYGDSWRVVPCESAGGDE